jgi:hypothetical protein
MRSRYLEVPTHRDPGVVGPVEPHPSTMIDARNEKYRELLRLRADP